MTVGQPYRETALAIPPAPYKHSFWMRIMRKLQRWRFMSGDNFCKRRPWPCPKCGKRGNAKDAWMLLARRGVRGQPRYQLMIDHPCCIERTHTETPSSYYIPFSRQRIRRLNAEQCQMMDEAGALYVRMSQHAAGGDPLRELHNPYDHYNLHGPRRPQ